MTVMARRRPFWHLEHQGLRVIGGVDFVVWLFSALVLVGVMVTLALLVEPPGVTVAMVAVVVVGVLL